MRSQGDLALCRTEGWHRRAGRSGRDADEPLVTPANGPAGQSSADDAIAARVGAKVVIHELAREYYAHRHFWFLFLPQQLTLFIAAVLAFLASNYEGKKRDDVEDTSGSLGFACAFIIAVDRYLDWHTLAEMHQLAATAYSHLKMELAVARTSGDRRDALRKLAIIEETTPAAHVPLALRECFDHVHWRITRSGSVPDYATVVAVEIMSSRWWPSRLPCPRRVGAAVVARLAETEGRF